MTWQHGCLLPDGLALPPHLGSMLSWENLIFQTTGSSVLDLQVSEVIFSE